MLTIMLAYYTFIVGEGMAAEGSLPNKPFCYCCEQKKFAITEYVDECYVGGLRVHSPDDQG